jgi:pSer/pThr/pTyr-binding forkhead associated (FHA) protein
LVERRYLFGRQEHCDIRINLLNVSREHAEIVVDEEDKVMI